MLRRDYLHLFYRLFRLSVRIMLNQPIESNIHLMKPHRLFQIIIGVSILYVGAILLFAKLMNALLMP
jgi:hypothetical protein